MEHPEMLGVTIRAAASKHPNPNGSALYSIMLFQVIALHIRELAVPSTDTVTHLVDEIKHDINLGSTRGTSYQRGGDIVTLINSPIRQQFDEPNQHTHEMCLNVEWRGRVDRDVTSVAAMWHAFNEI